MLCNIFFILIFSMIFTFFITKHYVIRYIALSSTESVIFLFSILLLGFKKNNLYFQYSTNFEINLDFFNAYLSFGLDGLFLFFFLLSNFLVYLCILILMVLIIGIWGSRERKIRAVYLFFFYTFIGSIFMLLSLLYIYSLTGRFADVVTIIGTQDIVFGEINRQCCFK